MEPNSAMIFGIEIKQIQELQSQLENGFSFCVFSLRDSLGVYQLDDRNASFMDKVVVTVFTSQFIEDAKEAHHLGAHSLLMSIPNDEILFYQWMRDLNTCIVQCPQLQFLVRVEAGNERHWHSWLLLQRSCESHPHLGIALCCSDQDLTRFTSEPVKLLIPQEIVMSSLLVLQRRNIPILLQNNKQREKFLSLFNEMNSSTMKKSSIRDRCDELYADQLQSALQPMADQLVNSTYQIFEQDKAKYDYYERAIYEALTENWVDLPLVSIAVLGAGRGPLVDAVLRSVNQLKRSFHLYVLEKNPHVFRTLERRLSSDWKDYKNQIHLHLADMRSVSFPCKMQLIVSELLGSFSDNELAPECLQLPLEKHLSLDGISIPSSSSSFIAPISNVSAWRNAKCALKPFVVHFRDCFLVSPPKELFTFHYDGLSLQSDAFASISFTNDNDFSVQCHGLAGHFESVLYKNVKISTLPQRHTPDMYSWFDTFLPIKRPFAIPPHSEIVVNFWRCSERYVSVWYEWQIIIKRNETIIDSSELLNGQGTLFRIQWTPIE